MSSSVISHSSYPDSNDASVLADQLAPTNNNAAVDVEAMQSVNRSMKELMVAGELHKFDAELWKAIESTKERCARFNAVGQSRGREGRHTLIKEMLGSVGEGADINPPFYCDFGSNIRLGEKTFLNYNCVILDTVEVNIGDNTLIGPAVQIYTVEHPRDPVKRSEGWSLCRPIHIGNNVWIGGGALILPGVTIGDNAIVGAGAVVTKDVAEGSTVVGNPARVRGDKKG